MEIDIETRQAQLTALLKNKSTRIALTDEIRDYMTPPPLEIKSLQDLALSSLIEKLWQQKVNDMIDYLLEYGTLSLETDLDNNTDIPVS